MAEDTKKPETASASGVYPVLPLRDIVVFPHMIVPLFVGREKSVRALETVQPIVRSLDRDPEIHGQFEVWNRERSNFNRRLSSGDPDTVHAAGVSIRGRLSGSEDDVGDEAYEDRIVQWPTRLSKAARRQP